MLTNLIILLLLSCAAIAAPTFEGRIVGGTNAKDGEFPYMVSVRKYNKHFCGGSILSNKFILTAAHCVYGDEHNPLVFKLQYGTVDSSNTKNILSVTKITMHKDYKNSGSLPNDVAIIQLKEEIPFGPLAKPVVLPSSTEIPAINSKTVLVGWGYKITNGSPEKILQKVELNFIADDVCKKSESLYDSRYHVCSGILTGGKGQCTADSGGPLTIGGKQFGVVSWSTKPCASPNHPGVFAKVTKYRAWIKEISGV